MLASQPLVEWLCVAVLAALAARSFTRLAADLAPSVRARFDPSAPACTRTSRVGEASHTAMALGMAAMVAVPATDDAPRAFEVYFAVNVAVVGYVWLARMLRRRVARMRGSVVPCRPAHALEPHHVIVGVSMIVMAARMSGPGSGAAMPGMAGMQGMTAASSGVGITTLALLYVWVAVVVLGGGLAKSATALATGSRPPVGLALLGAPATVYACELAMTMVMGLMLLG